MRNVIHSFDWYTKAILTIIAVALVALALRPLISSPTATASDQRQVIDVNLNIDRVGGEKLLRWWEADRAEKGIPLYIDGNVSTTDDD
jgi:hypothetical protein